VEHVLGNFYRIRRERDFVGRCAAADLNAIRFAGGALEIANQEGDEVGGHPGRGEELSVCLPAVGPGVSDSMGLLEMAVSPCRR